MSFIITQLRENGDLVGDSSHTDTAFSVVVLLAAEAKKAARDFLGIKHHRTLNTAIAILGISLPLDWNDLKRLIGLKLFLERNHGDRRASKETYRAFELAGRIEELHAFYKIDIETELKRRKNAYFGYSEQSSAG